MANDSGETMTRKNAPSRARPEQWSEDLIPVDRSRTLDGLLVHRVRRSPDRPAYAYHDRSSNSWCELTWRQFGDAVSRWRQALASEGLSNGERVAILLRNCPEWAMFDIASMATGLVTVPLYTDDRAENAAYILADAAVRVLLVQDANRWKRLAEAVGDQPYPERVVILESSAEAQRLAANDARVRIAADWLPAEAPALTQRDGNSADLATIVYTSGTTGRPKGVMLSHGNLLENAHAGLTALSVYPEDVFLSFLPLSHTLERTAGYYLPMMAGSRVAYARSVGQLGEDMKTVSPTILIAVPRVFERVYARIKDQLATKPYPLRRLFDLAVAAGWRAFEYGQGRAGWHPMLWLAPRLQGKVGAAVSERLGGRLRAAVSGGAPLPKEVARFFTGLGIPLLQGYGLTETSPVVSVNTFENNDPESVGAPVRGVQVRIGEDDELLVKGHCTMMGYWNNHAASARVLGPDGWLKTGDQARIDQGRIYITGRIKDILVLSNGEKVPPADMEMAITLDPLFEQVMVLGEGRSFLSALVVLNADLWPGLARDYGLNADRAESLDDHRLVRDILKRIRDALADFPGYAKVRRVTLLLEPWSVENGMMTPTMKIKRHAVVARYHSAVERMYSDQM